MATDHQLSMITNSSVKPPIRAHDGLPHTLHERVNTQSYWDEPEEDDLDAKTPSKQHSNSKVKHEYALSPRDPKIESLAEDLDTLSDEQFYARLQELKSDHQQTLHMCEKAYKDKINEMTGGSNHTAQDRVRDMSRPPLPPSVRTRQAWDTDRNITNNSSFFRRTTDSSANEESDYEVDRAMRSHDNTPLREKSGSLLDGLSDSMERIKGMWKDFNIDEYAPTPTRSMRERPASASGSNHSNKENTWMSSSQRDGDRMGDSWSPMITIPKPFKMMQREEKKLKTKTKGQEELEQRRLADQKAEEAELSKKFKASPAPAHIYLPLYDEIAEQQETKRRMNHHYREELLRSVEKPFKFYQREEAKKRQKLNQAVYDGMRKEKKTNTFKAKPVPKVLDEDVTERLAEEQEYRRIRVRMRAEELLRESKLPPSMDAREKTKDLNRIKQLARELRGMGLSSKPSFQPRIIGDAPDFEEKHRRLARQMTNKRSEREPTVTKPFNLRTSRQIDSKERMGRVIDDIERDQHELPETRWPYKQGRTKPSNIGKLDPGVTSSDRVPSMTTQSAVLRSSHTKKKLTNEMQKELSRLEAERKRRQKEKKLKSQVVEKAAANDLQYGLVDQSKQKLRQFREEERARQEEYRRSMKEMQDRVKERPLLFEQTSQKIARERAERRYNETLGRAGVSQDAMESRGGRAYSPGRAELSDGMDSDREGSYRAPVRRRDDFSSGGASPSSHKSPSNQLSHRSNSPTHNSYTNTFTKEETGLSDGDISDAESIPDRVLEMA